MKPKLVALEIAEVHMCYLNVYIIKHIVPIIKLCANTWLVFNFKACAARRATESEDQQPHTSLIDSEARIILHRNDATVPVIDMVLKTKYLKKFDAAQNGPLHEQIWCRESHAEVPFGHAQVHQGHCSNCRELWPTTDVTYASPNYVCRRRMRGLLYCSFYRPQYFY